MRRALPLAAIAALALAGTAQAQEPEVGGTVPDVIALDLGEPRGAIGPGPGVDELTVRARLTDTSGRARLSIADGDVAAGAGLGRLAGLRAPLEARVGARAFQPLDVTADPLLAAFRAPLANHVATIRLRQRIAPGERLGDAAKTVLITLSTTAP